MLKSNTKKSATVRIRTFSVNYITHLEEKIKSILHAIIDSFQSKSDGKTNTGAPAFGKNSAFSTKIKVSIITPLYNTPKPFLMDLLNSVINQTYSNWELCLADGSDPGFSYIQKICRYYAKKDKRIKYKKLKKNLGISANTNEGIKLSSGDYIGLLDHDDILHESALYEVVKSICEKKADFIYTDELIFRNNNVSDVFCYQLKPDYSPDTLRGSNYICHFSVFSRKLLDKVGLFDSRFDGSQDYDMTLRLTELAEHIVHIPKVLYYWRSCPGSVAQDISTKPYAIEAAREAVVSHLNRTALIGKVENIGGGAAINRIRYRIDGNPLISVLIANYEHKNDLEKCLNSIFRKTSYVNFEIIIIENNSKSTEIFKYYDEVQRKWPNVRVVYWDKEFNFSAINNYGATFAKGKFLLLLNNDTEVISPDWIQEMLMYSQRVDVGIVGCKLYYPNNTIQHSGVIIGMGGYAGHWHIGMPSNIPGFMSRLNHVQNFSAVTGACVMIRREVWEEIGGLDELFKVDLNDIDLCLRLRKAGYLVVWTPFAELYHYESKSRGTHDTKEKQRQLLKEQELFARRWMDILTSGDPYYNINLRLDRTDCAIINFRFKNFINTNENKTILVIDGHNRPDGAIGNQIVRKTDKLDSPNIIHATFSEFNNIFFSEHSNKIDLNKIKVNKYLNTAPITKIDYILLSVFDKAIVPNEYFELKELHNNAYKVYKVKSPSILTNIVDFYHLHPGEYNLEVKKNSGTLFYSVFEGFISTSSPGYVLYGPYITLNPGKYMFKINYTNSEQETTSHEYIGFADMNGDIPLVYNKRFPIYSDENEVIFSINTEKPCTNFEIRLFAEKAGISPVSVFISYSKFGLC